MMQTGYGGLAKPGMWGLSYAYDPVNRFYRFSAMQHSLHKTVSLTLGYEFVGTCYRVYEKGLQKP